MKNFEVNITTPDKFSGDVAAVKLCVWKHQIIDGTKGISSKIIDKIKNCNRIFDNETL